MTEQMKSGKVLPAATPGDGDSVACLTANADPDVRKAAFIAGIEAWRAERKRAPSEVAIRRVDGMERMLMLRNAGLDALSAYYREHPNADVAPGLISFLAVMADNETGASYVSVPRMAKFFSRSEKAVSSAVSRLEACTIIDVQRRSGQKSFTTLIIPPHVVADPSAPSEWTLDAYAPSTPKWPMEPVHHTPLSTGALDRDTKTEKPQQRRLLELNANDE